MTYFHPLWLEHQRKRFTRPDAYRLAPPGTPEARPAGYLHPSARMAAFERQQQEAAWQERVEREELQRKLDWARRELAEIKSELAARRAAWERADEAPRIKCDIAWDRFVRTYKRYVEQQKAGAERKWDGQPHDELGRFDFGKKPASQTADDAGGDAEDAAPATPEEIIATAKRENLAARPDKYQKCLDLCYPLLERRKPPGSDINTFDFHKCMAACMAREPL